MLFIFYIAEMFQECKVKTEKYADDATHVSAGNLMQVSLSHLQKDCKEITKWIGKWRLEISGPKTEVVIFLSIREERVRDNLPKDNLLEPSLPNVKDNLPNLFRQLFPLNLPNL